MDSALGAGARPRQNVDQNDAVRPPMAEEAGVRVLGMEREALPAAANRSVAAVTEEVFAYLDSQLPPTFGVLGWSGGAPFALAAAALFPERVMRAVVVCPLPGWLRGPGAVAATTPRLAAIAAGAMSAPGAEHLELLASPWGFEPSDIVTSLLVWYGGKDDVIPPDLVEAQLGGLVNVNLRLFADEGHFLPMGKWSELLKLAGLGEA